MLRARPIFTILFSVFWLINTISPSFAWNSMIADGPTPPEKTHTIILEKGNSIQDAVARSAHHHKGSMPNHAHAGMDSFGVAASDDHVCCEFSAQMQSHISTTSCSAFCASACSGVMSCLLPIQAVSLQVARHCQNRPPNTAFQLSPAYPPETPPPYIVS